MNLQSDQLLDIQIENYLPQKLDEFPFFSWQLKASLTTWVLHEYINH